MYHHYVLYIFSDLARSHFVEKLRTIYQVKARILVLELCSIVTCVNFLQSILLQKLVNMSHAMTYLCFRLFYEKWFRLFLIYNHLN